MVHPEYLKDTDDFETRAAHLVEEIGEVLSAYGKAKRFGWSSYDPTVPEDEWEDNYQWFMRECIDLRLAVSRLIELEGEGL